MRPAIERRSSDASAKAARLRAPKDCTQASALRFLLQDVRTAVHHGVPNVIIDMTTVASMNARLLATILLLAREVRRAGGSLRIEGESDEFRRWAATFHVLGPLERGGVLASANDPVPV